MFLKAVFIFIFSAGSFAQAGDLKLTWEHSDLDCSFRVFQREGSSSYNYATPAWTGPTKLATLSGFQEGTKYCFVVRAFFNYAPTLESLDSNEVCALPVRLPRPVGLKVRNFVVELNAKDSSMSVTTTYENEIGETIVTTTQKSVLDPEN